MPLPEPGPAPREEGSPEGGFPQYVRMPILAEELACRGKESLPGAWEVSHGSLYLELCSGRAGAGRGRGSQIMEILRPGWACGLVLEALGSIGGFYAGQRWGQVYVLERSLPGLWCGQWIRGSKLGHRSHLQGLPWSPGWDLMEAKT